MYSPTATPAIKQCLIVQVKCLPRNLIILVFGPTCLLTLDRQTPQKMTTARHESSDQAFIIRFKSIDPF